MTIATSSWFVRLDPEQYVRIGISRGVPRGQAAGFRKYPRLNPGPWFSSVSDDEYRARYYAEVLAPLDPAQVVADLEAIADGKIAALLCWEPPTPGNPWCHRALVSEWLFDTLGIEVFEVGQERYGCGRHHPKLAPQFRAQSELNLGGRPKDDRPPSTRA